MEVTAVVLHRGALAQYAVTEKGMDRFDAHLLSYGGDHDSSPPRHVILEKTGRHCVGNVVEVELLDDIYYAAKEELRKRV
ncbi:MAG: hypothetical protein EOO10_18375 [Chitinophagaceae bacterium]|nr:MAG: hypothetical protein EOO10_18375 [Chitinophagaceae bacterium]